MQVNRTKQIGNYLLLSVIAIILMVPLLLGISLSLSSSSSISQGNLFPQKLVFSNYVRVFTDTHMAQFLLHSLIVSGVVMIGQLVLSILAAYAFVFLDFKFKKTAFVIFLSTMMLPFESQIIPNFNLMRDLNLLNTYSAMALPFLASAFGTFMIKTSFEQLPPELKQLSQIEGLSHFQFITKVVMPYCKISLITFALYSFLTNWNMYLWPLISTDNDKVRTAQIGLRQMRAQDTASNWGLIMAATIIVVIPTMLIIFFGQKYFKNGLTSGVIK
ncbi:glycerol-3-phosphate ABC transporter permease [Weissella viridescens]|uniref:Glycerol-3-phosphate ABC transporter permease n=1 Tax=Weissella viridescens TaxID=1629 RepID=A0A0R2H3A0_WEIVI|nr:carbohydrate ABC transporter permease [Weissella viridescens]KRN47231.1 glycerol-3-phosphate ABC transporter permease [Weissella viridescens]GEA95301.1 glycerol-3-phosphate ABC transporter permease [Weissella viridescens]